MANYDDVTGVVDLAFLSSPPAYARATPSALLLPVTPVDVRDAAVVNVHGNLVSEEHFKNKLRILGFTNKSDNLETNTFFTRDNIAVHRDWFGVDGLVYTEGDDGELPVQKRRGIVATMPEIMMMRVQFNCCGHNLGRRSLPENVNLRGFFGPMLVTLLVQHDHGGVYFELNAPVKFA